MVSFTCSASSSVAKPRRSASGSMASSDSTNVAPGGQPTFSEAMAIGTKSRKMLNQGRSPSSPRKTSWKPCCSAPRLKKAGSCLLPPAGLAAAAGAAPACACTSVVMAAARPAARFVVAESADNARSGRRNGALRGRGRARGGGPTYGANCGERGELEGGAKRGRERVSWCPGEALAPASGAWAAAMAGGALVGWWPVRPSVVARREARVGAVASGAGAKGTQQLLLLAVVGSQAGLLRSAAVASLTLGPAGRYSGPT